MKALYKKDSYNFSSSPFASRKCGYSDDVRLIHCVYNVNRWALCG